MLTVDEGVEVLEQEDGGIDVIHDPIQGDGGVACSRILAPVGCAGVRERDEPGAGRPLEHLLVSLGGDVCDPGIEAIFLPGDDVEDRVASTDQSFEFIPCVHGLGVRFNGDSGGSSRWWPWGRSALTLFSSEQACPPGLRRGRVLVDGLGNAYFQRGREFRLVAVCADCFLGGLKLREGGDLRGPGQVGLVLFLLA